MLSLQPQNIYKRIKDNGLQVRYQQDAAFTLEVRMIAALAFVPGNDVNQYFNTLSGQIDQSDKIFINSLKTNTFVRPQLELLHRKHREPYLQHKHKISCEKVGFLA